MKPFRVQSTVEQLASFLREEILAGRWSGKLPGIAHLVRTLGVGTGTVVHAMDILKKEGLIEGKGARRGAHIAAGDRGSQVGLHFCLLMYQQSDLHDEHVVALKLRLEQLGHRVTLAEKTLMEMRFIVERVARFVEKTPGDAWIIRAGSEPILQWFAARPFPAFAMFGRPTDVSIAGLVVHKSDAMAQAVQRLVNLGHRRIVMLVGEDRRKPTPGLTEQRFREELKKLGVDAGSYHLPDWQNDRMGLHRCLDTLFRVTPPTALIAGDSSLFFTMQQFMLSRGIAVPRDVSLIAMDEHPEFDWFVPEVSRIKSDPRQWVTRVIQWASHVAQGVEDRHQTIIKSRFIEAGTIGPARH